MKTLKLLFGFMLSTTLLTSCYTEEININDNDPAISLNQLLQSYDLWYVDINRTQGFGETPFLQIAFTLTFDNGRMYANNNLVGFGNQGNGFERIIISRDWEVHIIWIGIGIHNAKYRNTQFFCLIDCNVFFFDIYNE